MDKIVSSGYKFDLHIHSCFSKNKDKDRVQNNTIANIRVLLNKLEENQVNICAITDHDVFNYEIYRKLKSNEGQGTLKKVLPGVEFSVSFKKEGVEKVVHVVTIFNDSDDVKIKNIEKILGLAKDKPPYDRVDAFSEETYFRLLHEIDLDTIMIAHQKNTLTSKAKAKKDDVLVLGEQKFNEFLFLDYFQAYEFRNKKNQLYNKTYINEKQLEGNLRMLTGSDCHDWNYYPGIDQNDQGNDFAFSYCKCLPTFKGLMMAVTDSRRIKLTNSFFNPNAKVEEIITIEVDQERVDVPLSKGINVIIGDNSIGKSLLLHALTNYNDCNTKLKTGYSKYLKEKKAAVISKIADEELFKCDMQGQIRRQFEEGAIKGSEFLLSYCPPDIDVREPRTVIVQELDKIYNSLQAKFDYDQKMSDLSFFKLIAIGSESQSLTFVGKIPDKKTEGFKQIVADIKEINQKLARLLKEKDLEVEDKKVIEQYTSTFHELETEYDQKIQDIDKENLIRNTVSSIIIEFKKRYSHQISDEQKIISSFLASKEEVVNEMYELVKKHNESKKPVITIPTFPIQPNESTVYKYTFVSKLNIDSISQDYFDSLFKRVFKKNNKLDFEKITSKKLKEYILYYPTEQAQPLEALKQKIKELLDADLSPRHSIIVKGMDRFKELSTGFNSQIYFSLLATESKNPGIYIVDQPEDNISQKSIRDTVLDDIKELGYNHQVIMVTHNPQFIVNLDVDNVIFMTVNEGGILQFKSGALEYECDDYAILDIIAENVDGGLASIEKRLKDMKKEFRLTHNNRKYEFMNTAKSGTSFTIESASLKFDIKDYYRVFFEDVSEKIEIDIVNDISAKDGAEIEKVGQHLFSTIKEITDKICAKLNEEYFTKT